MNQRSTESVAGTTLSHEAISSGAILEEIGDLARAESVKRRESAGSGNRRRGKVLFDSRVFMTQFNGLSQDRRLDPCPLISTQQNRSENSFVFDSVFSARSSRDRFCPIQSAAHQEDILSTDFFSKTFLRHSSTSLGAVFARDSHNNHDQFTPGVC